MSLRAETHHFISISLVPGLVPDTEWAHRWIDGLTDKWVDGWIDG